MHDIAATQRPPLGIRLLGPLLSKEPDWSTMSAKELTVLREAENRRRSSASIRLITGFPARGTTIAWQPLALAERELRVRVYRPSLRRTRGQVADALPLVLHVHGGGFVGTATQSDWINSHLAERLSAVVISVDHRLLTHQVPLSAAVDDGWDALHDIMRRAPQWGIDPQRVAVFGESAGAMIAALTAVRAKEKDVALRAQVLVNPCVDLTTTGFDYPSMTEHAHSPTLTVRQIEFFRRLAVPAGTDARVVSPLHTDDLSGLAPALVVVPTLDPLADHGRIYVERLRQAGTPARLSEHAGAVHAFLSVPRLVPQARAARADITGFLRDRFVSQPATE